MVCCPAMSSVSPVWPRKPKLWAFCVLLLVLLLSWKSRASVDRFQQCHWLVVLNNFEKKYMSFPYYLKVSFSCTEQLSIDSCWVGSYYCPMLQFSATIHDAISTESTLFIRQNQLVYYFTGRYTTLFNNSHSSSSWVRVLANECIKKLCPVFISGNGSEYILALTTGKHEGYIHFGTITDGLVSFRMVPDGWSMCDKLPGTHVLVGSGLEGGRPLRRVRRGRDQGQDCFHFCSLPIGSNCSINWATYIADEKALLLLVEAFSTSVNVFHLLNFNLGNQVAWRSGGSM
ncbi:Cation channel sperm-associated auxiliary subunit gamma 2 [Lemmus lemmus]